MDRTNANETEKKLDRWLDAALAHYSQFDEAEPRDGLEARVLATLEADRREREEHGYRWPWRLVLAGLAMVLIVVIAQAPWRSIHRPIVKPAGESATGVTTSTPRPQPSVVATVTSTRTPGTGSRPRGAHALAIAAEAAPPKLPQFPAPRPLSEQERLLVTLVNSASPEQLVEDAALQQRLRREVEEARMSGGGMLEPRGK